MEFKNYDRDVTKSFNDNSKNNNGEYLRGNYLKYTKDKKGYDEALFVYTLNNVITGEVLPGANNRATPYFFREAAAINKCKKINEGLLRYDTCQYKDLYKVCKYRLEPEYDCYIPDVRR